MEYGVFLSYRRADTAGHAGRIGDGLARRFGRAVIFRDIDAIAAGTDFVRALERAIADACACLVLIGDTWLDCVDADGNRRLDARDDTVRREIELALGRPGLMVVPVLVEGARMPEADSLPTSIRQLARLQAVELTESRWEYDMDHLAKVLEKAGVHPPARQRLPRWAASLIGLLGVALLASWLWCWNGLPAADDYAGLWYMPNGGYWSVREKDGRLWVEETHHDSGQVWKRGHGNFDGDELRAELALVFDHEEFRYLHRLRLSADRQTLVGEVRRSDQEAEQSLAMTRSAP